MLKCNLSVLLKPDGFPKQPLDVGPDINIHDYFWHMFVNHRGICFADAGCIANFILYGRGEEVKGVKKKEKKKGSKSI